MEGTIARKLGGKGGKNNVTVTKKCFKKQDMEKKKKKQDMVSWSNAVE